MKLRNKISIMIIVVWVFMAIVVYLGSQLIIKQSFLNLEEESAINNIQRIHQTIQQMEHSVASVLASWAIWDDTYNFMANKNQAYIDSNLTISSFTSPALDMILYFDTTGKPFYTIAADVTRTKEAPLPKGLFAYLTPSSKIVNQPNVDSGVEGLISVPSGILITAAHSIVTSNNTGPVRGTLMMARYFNDASLNELRNITKVDATIYPLSMVEQHPDLSVALDVLRKAPYFIDRKDDKTLNAYSEVKDINGDTIGIIKANLPRSIYQIGLKTIHYYNFIAIISSIMLLLVLWLSIHSFIVRRLEKLKNSMAGAKSDTELYRYVSEETSDEVSSVAALYHHATHDPLTGLANRYLLYQIFESRSPKIKSNNKIVLISIDIDHFKNINDALGHEIGDLLLIHISKQLTSCLRIGDLAIRLGGDDFVVLLFDLPPDIIEDMIKQVFGLLKKEVTLGGHELNVTYSMGVSIYPDNGKDIPSLLKYADIALYHAKESGMNQYQYYSNDLSKAIEESKRKELELQNAIDNKELCLYYQPIYNTLTREIINIEALIYWNHPQKGLLPAAEVFQYAEKSDLIIPIGKWALKAACTQMQIWQSKGVSKLPIAINLSLLQIKNLLIDKLVSEVLSESGLDPHLLELELTETSYIEINENIINELHSLKNKGIQFTVDDFGVGYSGLGLLKSLPISKIKIDPSFIRDIFIDLDDRAITLAIIAIGHQLNLQVVAAGVETEAQYEFLKNNNVDAVQGSYLCAPIDRESCEKLIESFIHTTE